MVFEYPSKEVEGDYALLVWNAKSDNYHVDHGVDSFVIRDGRIVMQSIFYRLAPGSRDPSEARR